MGLGYDRVLYTQFEARPWSLEENIFLKNYEEPMGLLHGHVEWVHDLYARPNFRSCLWYSCSSSIQHVLMPTVHTRG